MVEDFLWRPMTLFRYMIESVGEIFLALNVLMLKESLEEIRRSFEIQSHSYSESKLPLHVAQLV